jgi:hypothetical protein
VGFNLDAAMAGVTHAKFVAESWTDDFWAASGYDKTAVLAALDSLEKLVGAYAGTNGLSGTHDFSADGDVLETQSAAS